MVHSRYQVNVLSPNIHLRIPVDAGDTNSRIIASSFSSWRVAVDMIGVACVWKGANQYVKVVK